MSHYHSSANQENAGTTSLFVINLTSWLTPLECADRISNVLDEVISTHYADANFSAWVIVDLADIQAPSSILLGLVGSVNRPEYDRAIARLSICTSSNEAVRRLRQFGFTGSDSGKIKVHDSTNEAFAQFRDSCGV